MLAAWVLYPVLSPGEKSDISYDYTLDATGYHWEAELGEGGQPKTYEYGRRFRFYYDPRIEDRYGDPGPDLQAQYDRMLAAKQQEYDRRAPNQVVFCIVEFGDGTFELAAQPLTALPAPPVAPPTPEPAPAPPADAEPTDPDEESILFADHPILPAHGGNPVNAASRPAFPAPGSACVSSLLLASASADDEVYILESELAAEQIG